MQEPQPALVREFLAAFRHCSARVNGAIAGEDAPPEEVGRVRVDGELESAIEEPASNPVVESLHQTIVGANFDDALHLPARHQPHAQAVYNSEQAIAADGKAV